MEADAASGSQGEAEALEKRLSWSSVKHEAPSKTADSRRGDVIPNQVRPLERGTFGSDDVPG